MRLGLSLLRRECRTTSIRSDRRHKRRQELRALSAARSSARGDAVELSLLAGLSLRRAGVDGGQRWFTETRFKRAAVRAGNRGGLHARWFPAGCISEFIDWLRSSGGNTKRSARRRRD